MKWHSLVLLIAALLISMVRAQRSDDLPMLYYYDPLEHAYVIQEPGASEAWLFGEDALAPEHNSRTGPGWSPSAEWFAISSGNYGGYGGAFASSIEIIKRDGSQPVTVLEELQAYSVQIEWSPTDDLLLVYSFDEYTAETRTWPVVMLVDPNANAIVMSFDTASSAPQWSPDGTYLHFFRLTDPNDYQSRREAVFAAITGEIITQPVYNSSPCGAYWTWHPDGRYLSMTPDGTELLIQDLSTSATNEIRIPSNNIQQIEWSSDGRYGLVYTKAPCGTPASDTQLWLLDMITLEFRLIHDDAYAVTIDDFLYNYDSQLLTSWSPDSQKTLYWTGNGIFVFDIESGQSNQLPIETRASLENLKVRWFSDSNRIAVSWGDDLYVYAIAQEELVLLTENVRNFELSPDGNYVAVFSTEICPLAYICVLDTASATVIGSIPPPSSARDWGGQVEFLWHPNSQWLILGLQQNLDTGRQFLMLSDIRGEQRRELSLCYLGAACVGWVSASEAETQWGTPYSPLPLPDREINLGAEPLALEWHSDGQHFAVALAKELSVIDSTTLEKVWSYPLADDETIHAIQWREDKLLAEIKDNAFTEWGDDDEQVLLVLDATRGTVLQEYRAREIFVGSTIIVFFRRTAETIEIWDWDKHEMLLQEAQVAQIALVNDTLATVDSETAQIHLWHLDSSDALEELRVLEPEIPEGTFYDRDYFRLFMTADAQHLIFGRPEQNVSIWDVSTGVLVDSMPVFQFRLSDDRLNLYVIDSSNEVDVIPLAHDVPDELLDIEGQIVYYSAQTRRAISFAQATITVWNLDSHEAIFTRGVWLAYSDTAPLSVSPDGRYIALSGEVGLWGEDVIEIYDFASLELLAQYNRTASGFVWNADGTLLAAETLYTVSIIQMP